MKNICCVASAKESDVTLFDFLRPPKLNPRESVDIITVCGSRSVVGKGFTWHSAIDRVCRGWADGVETPLRSHQTITGLGQRRSITPLRRRSFTSQQLELVVASHKPRARFDPQYDIVTLGQPFKLNIEQPVPPINCLCFHSGQTTIAYLAHT